MPVIFHGWGDNTGVGGVYVVLVQGDALQQGILRLHAAASDGIRVNGVYFLKGAVGMLVDVGLDVGKGRFDITFLIARTEDKTKSDYRYKRQLKHLIIYTLKGIPVIVHWHRHFESFERYRIIWNENIFRADFRWWLNSTLHKKNDLNE
jgi:hypothetical protein